MFTLFDYLKNKLMSNTHDIILYLLLECNLFLSPIIQFFLFYEHKLFLLFFFKPRLRLAEKIFLQLLLNSWNWWSIYALKLGFHADARCSFSASKGITSSKMTNWSLYLWSCDAFWRSKWASSVSMKNQL